MSGKTFRIHWNQTNQTFWKKNCTTEAMMNYFVKEDW